MAAGKRRRGKSRRKWMRETPGNVIFVHCDSMDGRCLGAIDHPAVQTPCLNRLAERGMVFENAYCNAPMCCPSRASMLSGRYTHNCEGWNNFKGLSPGDPTLFSVLAEHGYTVAALGKTDYVSGHHSVRARVTAWTRGLGIRRPAYRQPHPTVIDVDGHQVHRRDWKVIDEAAAWLREHAHDGPFMLYCGLHAPHPPFTTSWRWLNQVDPTKIPMPPLEGVGRGVHPFDEVMRVQKNWEHGLSEDRVRMVRRIYYAMIAEVDAMVGRLLEDVGRLGLEDSTYIIFASDHGEMNMEHGQFFKMSLYEPSVRVPLLISGPNVLPGRVCPSLVSLVDVYPTILDIAGIPADGERDGHSLMPALMTLTSDRPRWVFSEFHGSTAITGSFMVRRGDWKLIHHVDLEPQLFNLREDPWEDRNLSRIRPDILHDLRGILTGVCDPNEVHARAAACDRESFRAWRHRHREAGDYNDLMARIYSGWDNVSEDDLIPWTAEDEAGVVKWLSE